MRLVIVKSAAKTLRRMQPKAAQAIMEKLEVIAADPLARHANVKKLVGATGFRLRHGDWRVLYRVDRKLGTMFVDVVGIRGQVYK